MKGQEDKEKQKKEEQQEQLQSHHRSSSSTGKEIALKIFELGLKRYIHEPAYVFCYLDFLGHLNDDKSTFYHMFHFLFDQLDRTNG
jgi:hypothetical protein